MNARAPRDKTSDRWRTLGLFDAGAPGADDVLDALEFFESVGVDPNEFVGTDPAEVVSTVNLRMLTSGTTVDAATVRARAGLDLEAFGELCQAAGYDPEGTFSPGDVEAFAAFAVASELFSREELVPFIRVIRSQMSHVADAMTALFRIDVSVPLDRAGATQAEHARKNWESSQLIPHAMTAIQAFLEHELIASTMRSDRSRLAANASNATTVKLAIGFVDIVGYTPMADRLGPDELGAFIVDFERKAAIAVSEHRGRVVKLIGDEVMFVVVEPDAGFDIAQALIAAFADTDVTPRAGVVWGDMVARGGDYYGRVVNLAARVSAQAGAGEVLTDADTAAATTTHHFDTVGPQTLRGFARPVDLRSLRSAT